MNGIDFLEVLDIEALDPGGPWSADQRQRILFVHFINPLDSPLSVNNFRILGGERIRGIQVVNVTAGTESNVLIVEVDQPGDFSIYTIQIVKDQNHSDPPDDIDPVLAEVDFSFKVECPTEFDCKSERVCPTEPEQLPEINYLAKDYASFRQLMLDRMALLIPQWKERSPADLGIALVELLAYVGDHLSYQQDAVGTEAYLHTARRRVSVRRHARLVDYSMHDGCNARGWVQVLVDADNVVLKKKIDVNDKEFITKFLTGIPNKDSAIDPNTRDYNDALSAHPIVFELCENEDKTLYETHNKMFFYTWSDTRCCLPKGATSASLKGHFPHLKKNDVLIFEEVKGPNTEYPGDADPARRHPLRLTNVMGYSNGIPLKDPVTDKEITEIEWAKEDALPFPFCISSRTDREHGERLINDVSLVRGNIVLADHGLTIEEDIDKMPESKLFPVQSTSADRCEKEERPQLPQRFWPHLKERPLTQAAPYESTAPAAEAMRWSMRNVDPEIHLYENSNPWGNRRDLLDSNDFQKHFVVEIEKDSTAYLRFGDDQHGKRPDPGMGFTAIYRVGNGAAGNIGAEALKHIVTDQNNIIGVRNLLPAQGGVEPESMEEVRLKAPYTFRTQERAVTPQDYAEVTERQPGIQKAAATMRWTGSWYTVFLTIDRMGGLEVDRNFEDETRSHVERYRMAGHDLEVDGPRYVPLEIEMKVCAKPDYFRGDVKKDLLDVFSNSILPDGRRGVFHPDNFTFDQTLYLSTLYAAAQKVPGVGSVHITMFQRQGKPETTGTEKGKLELNRLEIARLDNDRNYPERGVFRLELGGGK